MTGLTVEPVQVGATQFDRASNRQRHRVWRRRSLFRRRTVCRPASTERGVAVPQPQAIEPTRTCDRRDHWFQCLCLRRRRALLGRGARPDDCQRRSDERSRDEHNASFSHAGPAFSACSAKDISARCPRVSMSPAQSAIGPPIRASGNTADPFDRACLWPPPLGPFRRTADYFPGGRKNPSDHRRPSRATTCSERLDHPAHAAFRP